MIRVNESELFRILCKNCNQRKKCSDGFQLKSWLNTAKMDFCKILWNQIKSQMNGISPQVLIEKLLMLALEFLVPVKIENGKRNFSKSLEFYFLFLKLWFWKEFFFRFLLTAATLISTPIVVTLFLLQKQSEIDFETLVNNAGVFREILLPMTFSLS